MLDICKSGRSLTLSTFRLLLLVGFSTFLVFGSGCSSSTSKSSISGKVLIDGQPLENATLEFVPQSSSTPGVMRVITKTDGTFSIQDDVGNPITPGMYAVVVSKTPQMAGGNISAGPAASEVPAIYSSRDKTPLTAEIKLGSNALPPFELTRSS